MKGVSIMSINKILINIALLFMLTGYALSLDTEPQLLATQIQEQFANYQRTIITYQGSTYVPPLPESASMQRQQLLSELNEKKMILEKRKNGTLSNEKTKEWEKVTDESILNRIRFIENLFNGYQYDFLKVLSTNGRECRIDVFRPNGRPTHEYYLFDGLNGYLVTEDDNSIITAPSFTRNWLRPSYFFWTQYGFGIDRYLRLGYRITQIDSEKRTFRIASSDWKDVEFEFTRANEHDLYWQQCEGLSSGQVVERIVCENFEEHDGLWIPKNVRTYRIFGNQPPVLQEEMILQEVSVNPGTMEDGLFATPDANSMKVRHLNR